MAGVAFPEQESGTGEGLACQNLAMAANSPYDDLVMDHIRNARNYRMLDDADRQSQGSNVLCGDEVTVYLKVNADRIEDAAFQCSCCGIAMASASMLTESVVGRSTDEARGEIRRVIKLIGERAGAGEAPGDEWLAALIATVNQFPTRSGCAMLPWVTLDAALDGRPMAAMGS